MRHLRRAVHQQPAVVGGHRRGGVRLHRSDRDALVDVAAADDDVGIAEDVGVHRVGGGHGHVVAVRVEQQRRRRRPARPRGGPPTAAPRSRPAPGRRHPSPGSRCRPARRRSPRRRTAPCRRRAAVGRSRRAPWPCRASARAPRSAAVSTATTPGMSTAAEVSMPVMRACAISLRTNTTWSGWSSGRSAT